MKLKKRKKTFLGISKMSSKGIKIWLALFTAFQRKVASKPVIVSAKKDSKLLSTMQTSIKMINDKSQ